VTIHWQIPKPPPNGRPAFHHFDRFIVVNTATHAAVESHATAAQAERRGAILNAHNEANNHVARYTYYPLPIHCHNTPPEHWSP
jgi:hypothetical protein